MELLLSAGTFNFMESGITMKSKNQIPLSSHALDLEHPLHVKKNSFCFMPLFKDIKRRKFLLKEYALKWDLYIYFSNIYTILQHRK
jgi:hypothetical protein